jgi:pSer/pThr/pTyr-binding forkhead associated (FHA) protein
MPQLAIVLERTPLKVLDLDHPVIRIGRDTEMDVVIDDLSVSRRQAELRQEGSRWKIRDLSSSNGTFLNGARLTGVDALKSGDEITFGRFSVFFDHVPAAPIGVENSPRTGGPRPASLGSSAPTKPPRSGTSSSRNARRSSAGRSMGTRARSI